MGKKEGISIAVKAFLNLFSKSIITLDDTISDSGVNNEELGNSFV